MSSIQAKIIGAHGVLIILLLWLYALSIQGLVDLFTIPLGLPYSPFLLSLLFSCGGIILGFLVYAGSKLQRSTTLMIEIGIPLGLGVFLLLIGLLYPIEMFLDVALFLLKVGLGLILCAVPLVGIYGLLKKEKNIVLASGFGLIFFFFFTRLLLKNVVFIEQNIMLLLLFFICFIVYLELATRLIFFMTALSKLTRAAKPDALLLQRYNHVFNVYLLFVSILFTSVYLLSIGITSSGMDLFLFTGDELFSVSLATFAGMILLVCILLAAVWVIWGMIPREKPQDQPAHNESTKTEQF